MLVYILYNNLKKSLFKIFDGFVSTTIWNNDIFPTSWVEYALKADRASSKLNFLFHLKSKTNLVTLKKFNLHLKYYKLDSSFSIKLQEINLNVCEEHKTESRAWR